MSEGPIGGGRQTRSYLMDLLQANGLRPERELGQNFLIDLNLLDLLVRSANLGSKDVVLEVGSGTGGLTTRLSDVVAQVVSVEIDPGFFRLASEMTSGRPNVTLLHTDALASKNKFNPDVLTALAAAMQRAGAKDYQLVANLPYDVAASVVGNLLLEDLPVRALTFTVQLEMAERIAAGPGSRDYGPLSALVTWIGQIHWVRRLPPEVFWPRPKIHSAILHLDVTEERRRDLPYLRRFHRFVRDLFMHRRKILRAAIASIPGYKHLKPQLDQAIAELGLQSNHRAEQLDVQRLMLLFDALERLQASTSGSANDEPSGAAPRNEPAGDD